MSAVSSVYVCVVVAFFFVLVSLLSIVPYFISFSQNQISLRSIWFVRDHQDASSFMFNPQLGDWPPPNTVEGMDMRQATSSVSEPNGPA